MLYAQLAVKGADRDRLRKGNRVLTLSLHLAGTIALSKVANRAVLLLSM